MSSEVLHCAMNGENLLLPRLMRPIHTITLTTTSPMTSYPSLALKCLVSAHGKCHPNLTLVNYVHFACCADTLTVRPAVTYEVGAPRLNGQLTVV